MVLRLSGMAPRQVGGVLRLIKIALSLIESFLRLVV
jgi:hypothetical protein